MGIVLLRILTSVLHFLLLLPLAVLGAALTAREWRRQGMACYEQVLRLTPNMPEAHVNLAVILYMQGNLPKAIGHLETAVRLAPGSAKARNNLTRPSPSNRTHPHG